ncbi:MAG: stage II sporulation protein M [Halobacteriota archaeon]
MEEKVTMGAYLYSLRYYVLFIIALFVCSAVIAYAGFLNNLFRAPFEWIRQISENVHGYSEIYPTWILFLLVFALILMNNAFACFLDIISGPLVGIFPIFSSFINGGLVGWFAREEGLIVLIGIVPHGLFELPAFFISAAIGLKLGREVLKSKGERNFTVELRKGLRLFFTLIILLLFIAALIESALIVFLPLLLESV